MLMRRDLCFNPCPKFIEPLESFGPLAQSRSIVDVALQPDRDQPSSPRRGEDPGAREGDIGVVRAGDDDGRKGEGRQGQGRKARKTAAREIGPIDIGRGDQQRARHCPPDRDARQVGDQCASETVGYK